MTGAFFTKKRTISHAFNLKEDYFLNKKQQHLIGLSLLLSIVFGISKNVDAMHIMEGYLSPKYCILWGALCIPFLIAGFASIKKTIGEHRSVLLILAMAGAYAFVLSSLKIPSVTGSSSHMTGTGLGAILFGPFAMSILGTIVLLFQAILLAHGGLTTLGANIFSMAIGGPVLTYLLYRLLTKFSVSKYVSIFFAAMLGDLFTYCITSIQLGVAFPDPATGLAGSVTTFLGLFAVTQIPLAIIEGILTVVVMMGLESYAKPELKALNYFKGGIANVK